MATLPSVLDLGSVKPSKPGGAIGYNPVPRNSGADAEALQNLGNVITKSADVIQKHVDTVKTEDAYNQLIQKSLDLSDGDNGFRKVKGSNAINGDMINTYGGKFDSTVKNLASTLDNADQRSMFMQRANATALQFKHEMLNHLTQENEVYSKQVLSSGVEVESQKAALNYGNEDAVNASLARVNGLVSAEASRTGVTGDGLKAAQLNAMSQIHTAVVGQMIKDDKDFDGADNWIKDHKEQMTSDTMYKLERLVSSMRQNNSNDMKVTIQDKLRDMEAMASRGQTPPPGYISDSDIRTAYPNDSARGQIVSRQVAATYKFAGQVSHLNQLTNDQIEQYVTKTTVPQIGAPEGYAEAERHNEMLQSIGSTIIKQRMLDPMSYAQQQNIGVVNSIDFNTKDWTQELSNRERTAKLMNEKFGSPLMLLTRTESADLGAILNASDGMSKVALLDQLRASINDPMAYNGVIQQIRPDSPVTAFIGDLMQKQHVQESGAVKVQPITTATHWFSPDETMSPRDVALRIAQGESILNPTKGDRLTDGKPKFDLPPDKQLHAVWDRVVGDAYRGMPNTYNTSYQAFKAFYAAEAASQGKYDSVIETDIAEKAARVVSGGVTNAVGGKNVLLPWGMSQDEFYLKAKAAWEQARKDNELPENADFGSIALDNFAGEGRYAVRAGSGPVYGKNGEPIILTVK